jgi:hypothetical protein
MEKILFCVLIVACTTKGGMSQVIRVPVGKYDTVYTQTQLTKTISIPCDKGGYKNCIYYYPIISVQAPNDQYFTTGPYVVFFGKTAGLYKTKIEILWTIDTPECNRCTYFVTDSLFITTEAFSETTSKVIDYRETIFWIFPNPSAASIELSCTLQKSSRLFLHIFNELGKDILTVYDGILTEGPHDFSFKLSPGMYYARMETAEGVVTKKIIVE